MFLLYLFLDFIECMAKLLVNVISSLNMMIHIETIAVSLQVAERKYV